MLIEQAPLFYRMLYPNACWRKADPNTPCVYLTFDDGPIPEVTPWVLDELDKHNIKATFFCVGENVRRNPEVYQDILDRGHKTGNHTMNHIQGLHYKVRSYLRNTQEADKWIKSDLFRPPHGHLLLGQLKGLQTRYQIIMWDVVTRDYSKRQNATQVLNNVKQYTRNGSIIVFHDSLKAEKNLKQMLSLAIEWLKSEGYEFRLL